MKLESLKDLAAVIDLCRRKNVTDISIDGISLKLGSAPKRVRKDSKDEAIDTPQVSEEDMLFWSVQQ